MTSFEFIVVATVNNYEVRDFMTQVFPALVKISYFNKIVDLFG